MLVMSPLATPPPAQPPLPPPGTTVAEAGEFGLLALVTPRFPQGPDVVVGPGDDAAQVSVPGGTVLVATDVLVDGRHFRRDWASAADIGRRAAAQSLSDINAMGGRPTAVTVGLATPAEVEVAWLVELSDGIGAECATVGASVVGGDLTRSDVLVVSVTALGTLAIPGAAAALRSGARPGDVVALCGRQGWAAAGLAVLSRGFRSPRAVVEAYRRPEVPYGAGAEALEIGATALVDVSDGLLADLGHVARASAVHIDLSSTALTVDEPLRAVGAAVGVDPLSFVLGGGDDHSLVATFPPQVRLPARWSVIGAVTGAGSDSGSVEPGTCSDGAPDSGPAVTVDGAAYQGSTGFRHF
jgi:thiamine-monophosphate kinase